jgi:hypothetical protein
MKKFVFVYYGKVKAKDIRKEDMQKTMDKWMAWFGTFKDKIVDGGNPFRNDAKSVTAQGVETISADKWPAIGYTIINAESMEEATKIAQGCPALEDDSEGTVRVYEVMPYF